MTRQAFVVEHPDYGDRVVSTFGATYHERRAYAVHLAQDDIQDQEGPAAWCDLRATRASAFDGWAFDDLCEDVAPMEDVEAWMRWQEAERREAAREDHWDAVRKGEER